MSAHGSESENPAIDSPEPKTAAAAHQQGLVAQPARPLGPPPALPSQRNPLGEDFDYAEAFATLDVEALKRDIVEVMTTSQDWWPADFGHYGGLFIRMSWHAAGTYRIEDGRGGAGDGSQRFAPLNSWPDNANLDKARRLLWPVKQKYGQKISWADLLVLAGNVALEDMGFETFGFGFGREDVWEPEEIFWGPEDTWLGDERYSGERELAEPLGAVQMGLIYVNPEGPNGEPDPVAAARDIRETFRRMAMNDEETVALIAGGHSFGKTHGAGDPDLVGPEPEGCPARGAGPRLEEHLRLRQGRRRHHQRPRGDLDRTRPTRWGNSFFENLFGYEYELTQSPAGAHQWVAKDAEATVPDAARPVEEAPADDADHRPRAPARPGLREDLAPLPTRTPTSSRLAFAKAWYKLLHRDMGPVSRYLGPWVAGAPAVAGPRPGGRPRAGRCGRHRVPQAHDPRLRALRVRAGLHRMGRCRELPRHRQARWRQRCADPSGAAEGLGGQRRHRLGHRASRAGPAGVQRAQSGGKRVSLADLIVLAGSAAVEQAARDAGVPVEVPFAPGRTDATQEQTDVESFSVLEPRADGFRNYLRAGEKLPPETLLLDRANLLSLTAPEMTVLVGGMRALGANHGGAQHGVFTDRPGVLSTDFFVNLLDMGTEWKVSTGTENVYEGHDRATGEVTRTATAVDLVFGSNSQLRAIAEVYAEDDAKEKFVQDFVAAWVKVMNLDRFDLA